MKKGFGIIISTIIVIGIILCGTYYALAPSEKVETSKGEIINIENLLTQSPVQNFKLFKNPLRLEGNIYISDEEFKNLVYTAIKQYNIEEFKNIYVDINKSDIKAISPYKVLGFIDSQIEFKLKPTIVDNNLNIKLTDFKLGKIKISNETVSKQLKSYQDKIPFTIRENEIIVDKSYTYPIKLNDINIKENKIIVDLNVEADNLIDFISKYKIKIKE